MSPQCATRSKARKPVLSLTEIDDTVKELRRKVVFLQGQRTRELAARNLEEAKSFLEANAKKEGVITLPSGLQYRVIREGKGQGPKATDGVRMRYRGTLVNGTEFDNAAKPRRQRCPGDPGLRRATRAGPRRFSS